MVASIVYALDGAPLVFWPLTLVWLALLALLSLLMVSTWRYRSLKDIQLLRPRAPYTMIVAVSAIVAWWMFTAPLVLAVTTTYVGSGIAVRLGGIVRRRLRHAPEPEHQVG
jgi:CDP-diacylglycerol--serine O-phosphatidyltransferase